METLFLPVSVDPGRTTVFTATISHSEDKKEFRTCSSKERQSFAGTDRMIEHIQYILTNLEQLFRFYNFQSAAFRFYDYQGRQRANAEMANILLNGGKKYNKSKRKKTNRNKRRKRRRRRSKAQEQVQPVANSYHPREPVFKKAKFTPSLKVPVVVFGDGLKNKEKASMKGQLSGTSGVCLRSLYQRQNN